MTDHTPLTDECGPCSLDVHDDCHRHDGDECGCTDTPTCGAALRVFHGTPDYTPLSNYGTENVWCQRCKVRHECSTNHGPDGHGGSSVCCPVRQVELNATYKAHQQRPDHAPLTDEHGSGVCPICSRKIDEHTESERKACHDSASGFKRTALLADEPTPCAFGDPTCPCQDGDSCHYVDLPGSPAMRPPPLTDEELAEIKTMLAMQQTVISPSLYRSWVGRLVAEVERLRGAIEPVRRAVHDPGIAPGYHRQVMRQTQLQWPTLWRAIEALLK